MISNCKLLTKKYREKFFKIYCQKSLDYSRKIVIFAIPNFKYFIFFSAMTIQEFTDNFLPTLSLKYKRGEMDLHALVDIETWRKVFPDNREVYHDFLWYQIKLNSFALKDGTGLIVYSLPEPNKTGERKFIGIRFDNKSRDLSYYVLERPRFYDATWEIYQYSFANHKYVFDYMINGTHSLRDFVNTIDAHKAEMPKGLFDYFKEKIKESFQMQ